MSNNHDVVNNPQHYAGGTSLECIECMRVTFGARAVYDFCLCNAFFSRKQSTKAKKARQQHPAAPETENSFDQALRIMTLQDDARRHYEKLPEKARKKSIFGGKMIN